MPTPAPSATPFDITAIPSFPFVPSLLLWIAVIISGAVLVATAYFLSRGAKERRVALDSYHTLQSELINIRNTQSSSSALSKELVSRVSSLLRHYLTLRAGLPIWQLTPHELEQYAESLTNSQVFPLLASLIKMESAKYLPGEITTIPESALSDAMRDLERYEHSLTELQQRKGGAQA